MTLLLCHDSCSHCLLSSRRLLLAVLLDVIKVTWIEPSVGEEVVVFGELLLKPLQMDSKSALPGDIVHAQEVVNSLEGLED